MAISILRIKNQPKKVEDEELPERWRKCVKKWRGLLEH